MTVENLINDLQKMPKGAEVFHLWDGQPRTIIEIVYLSKSGDVITSDFDEACYSDKSRPLDAPNEEEEPYWYTPSKPN